MNIVDFWSKVDRGDRCWFWTGAHSRNGYGNLWNKESRRWEAAHRVAWESHAGPIPSGLLVLHHCDNKSCVNPSHLFLGTYADNAADMLMKNRSARGHHHYSHRRPELVVRGERNGRAKLNLADVRAIREQASMGLTQAVIAAQFGVSQSLISRIAKRALWKHVI